MGRQPSSGYCQTCRKRRVKCGMYLHRGQPACRRCLTSGHRCDGYDTPLRMHILSTRPEKDGVPRMVVIAAQSKGQQTVQLQVLAPSEPSHTALTEDTAALYFFNAFVWAPFWRSFLLSASSPENAASKSLAPDRACFDALVYGYTGLGLGHASLQDRARQLYTGVLGQMQKLLRDAGKPELAKLIRAVVIMAMYEFAVNREMGESPPHHFGICWILRHCGPESFQGAELLHVFRSCRSMLFIWRRSHLFLEDEAWKTVPWRHTPKTLEDRIMDIFVDLPGLSEDTAVPEKLITVREKIHALMATLQTWRKDWDASYQRARSRPPPADDEENSIHPLFRDSAPNTLKFDSPTQALEILLYNASLLYLIQLLKVAIRRISELSPFLLNERTPKPGAFLLTSPRSSRIQPALEGLQALSAMPELCNRTEEKVTVVPPTPVAILYWAVQEMPELTGSWDAFLSRFRGFDAAQEEFEGFRIGIWE
ncbi:hypothetical protein B0T14DRAFT_441180 [Immersiella caudata]|uniref:Zn(2)-C6 fungal-type domain-containing protein n=1 Tax=Immersiella caudata TaxID=314043 RepID=A0AA39WAH1_9PEZI|nr:hypothetical protein B0T14DRAFT_441180 [Immersiella caudata]